MALQFDPGTRADTFDRNALASLAFIVFGMSFDGAKLSASVSKADFHDQSGGDGLLSWALSNGSKDPVLLDLLRCRSIHHTPCTDASTDTSASAER